MIAIDLHELLQFCFGNNNLQKPIEQANYFYQNAILCATNAGVSSINQTILKLLPGNEVVLYSIDKVIKQDALDCLDVHFADNHMEQIYRQTPTGLPPHELNLKIGAIIMLIRNISIREGLCNGTRLQVLDICDNLLQCHILTGN